MELKKTGQQPKVPDGYFDALPTTIGEKVKWVSDPENHEAKFNFSAKVPIGYFDYLIHKVNTKLKSPLVWRPSFGAQLAMNSGVLMAVVLIVLMGPIVSNFTSKTQPITNQEKWIDYITDDVVALSLLEDEAIFPIEKQQNLESSPQTIQTALILAYDEQSGTLEEHVNEYYDNSPGK